MISGPIPAGSPGVMRMRLSRGGLMGGEYFYKGLAAVIVGSPTLISGEFAMDQERACSLFNF